MCKFTYKAFMMGKRVFFCVIILLSFSLYSQVSYFYNSQEKGCYIVDVVKPLTHEQQILLKSNQYAWKIEEYITPNQYLISVDTNKMIIPTTNLPISAIREISINNKISNRFNFKDSGVLYNCWIEYCKAFSWDEIKNLFNYVGININERSKNLSLPIIQCSLTASQIRKIAALSAIIYIEPAPLVEENENNKSNQNIRSNYVKSLPLPQKLSGKGMKIMLNDEGEVGHHIDWIHRVDQTEASALPDFADHASHIAGTLIGAGNRDPRYEGMAPGAFLKVYSYTTDVSTDKGFFAYPDAYHIDSICITSTSQSDGCNAGYTLFTQLIDQQIHTLPSLMHVFSAGNMGNNQCGYGAGNGWGTITGGHKQAKNVLTVGNIIDTDLLVGSSSKGPSTDGRIKPECVAVGTNVNSTTNYPDESTYTLKSGSSHACPAVAGSLALLYEGFHKIHQEIPSSDVIKAAVLNTCDDLGNPGPDFMYGFGRPNIRRAYELITQGNYFKDTVIQNQIWDTIISVQPGIHELRVMLYWNDVPGSVMSTQSLVNDLDLYILSPDSVIYLPWVLNSYPHSDSLNLQAIRKRDSLNNIEQITVLQPMPGNWKIAVHGYHIPMGPQPFAIVYEYLQPQIVLTYPNGNEKLVPGELERIRWDGYGNFSTNFQLSYSSDAGNTWHLIQNNISSAMRYYDWIVPSDVSGKYMIRIENGSFSDFSDTTFSVMYTADSLHIDTICNDMVLLNWPDVSGASGYIVYQLGNFIMDSLTYTIQSQQWVSIQGAPEENWFSVAALGTNDAISRRAYAIRGSQYHEDCNTALLLNETDNKAIVYPIPASHELFISWAEKQLSGDITIIVYEISGRRVMYKKHTEKEQIILLDISSLTNGVYLLSVQHNEGLNTWRFIKQ